MLQLVPALNEGGVERGTIEITAAITAAGGRALVASAGGRLEPSLRRAGGELFRLPLDGKAPWRILANARALTRLIRAEGVEIVHARSRAPAWAGWIAARTTGTPFVTTYHGSYSEGLPLKRLYNSVMARGDPVIAISAFIAGEVARRHRVPASRIVTIPRGADVDLFDESAVNAARTVALATAWGIADDPRPLVVLPGRLTRWKGQALLIEAAAKVRARRGAFPARLVFVGGERDTPYAQELERLAERRGLGADVSLVGPCLDMPAAYRLAALVVCPSLRPEAFGRTVIEAQAMARTVIAADHGGARETVVPGETGWLVPPRDAGALAEALDAALALPGATRAAMGAAGRARIVADYSTRAMQAATLAVYAGVLARRGTTGGAPGEAPGGVTGGVPGSAPGAASRETAA